MYRVNPRILTSGHQIQQNILTTMVLGNVGTPVDCRFSER